MVTSSEIEQLFDFFLSFQESQLFFESVLDNYFTTSAFNRVVLRTLFYDTQLLTRNLSGNNFFWNLVYVNDPKAENMRQLTYLFEFIAVMEH